MTDETAAGENTAVGPTSPLYMDLINTILDLQDHVGELQGEKQAMRARARDLKIGLLRALVFLQDDDRARFAPLLLPENLVDGV